MVEKVENSSAGWLCSLIEAYELGKGLRWKQKQQTQIFARKSTCVKEQAINKVNFLKRSSANTINMN